MNRKPETMTTAAGISVTDNQNSITIDPYLTLNADRPTEPGNIRLKEY